MLNGVYAVRALRLAASGRRDEEPTRMPAQAETLTDWLRLIRAEYEEMRASSSIPQAQRR